MNGNKLKGSWIENEDELIINIAVIQFEHQENDLLVSVSDISGEQPTIFEKRQSKEYLKSNHQVYWFFCLFGRTLFLLLFHSKGRKN